MAAALAVGTAVLQKPATAETTDGTATIRVVRDSNTDGFFDSAKEIGVAGLTVELMDADGVTVTAVTDASGVATFPPNASMWGGRYYVRVRLPNGTFLTHSFAGAGGIASEGTIVDVADGKNASLTMGVWNTADSCQDNPDLTTVCQVATNKSGGVRTTVAFPFNSRGNSSAQNPRTLATRNDTGNTYGIAYHRQLRRIFTGAHAKRHTVYGPSGQGAIYITPRDGGPTTLFTVVPNAGTTAHNDPNRFDGNFVAVVGKESLGDIDISEDMNELYVVNLNDRSLYTYDANQITANGPSSVIPIPDPGCPAAGDWRPFGLGVQDRVVYVGGVCSGESSQNLSNVEAVVWTYNAATTSFGATPILRKTLDFPRGRINVNFPISTWFPWTTGVSTFPSQVIAHPEPLLSDIVVESNGDLVLGFRDRFADMTGYEMPNPNAAYAGGSTNSGGDLNRACRTAAGTFEWEGVGNCPNNAASRPNGGQPANVIEFYPGDFVPGAHLETAQGAIALSLREQRLASTAMDPANTYWTAGTAFFDRLTGSRGTNPGEQGFTIQYLDAPQDGGFGKANGLGDLELLCDLPPVQIGSRVWYDRNRGGAQSVDDDEPGLPGVTVQLLAQDGTVLATKRTGVDGAYYFGPQDGVRPNTAYKIRFDKSTADVSVIQPRPPSSAAALVWSPVRSVGAPPDLDSDAVPDGANNAQTATADVTTGPPGTTNHTIDAGLYVNRL